MVLDMLAYMSYSIIALGLKVTCRGQILGLILANDQQTAKNAARRVTVTYENLPSILSIQASISVSQETI